MSVSLLFLSLLPSVISVPLTNQPFPGKNGSSKECTVQFVYNLQIQLSNVIHLKRRKQKSFPAGGLIYVLWLFCWRPKKSSKHISPCMKFPILLEMKHKLNSVPIQQSILRSGEILVSI